MQGIRSDVGWLWTGGVNGGGNTYKERTAQADETGGSVREGAGRERMMRRHREAERDTKEDGGR